MYVRIYSSVIRQVDYLANSTVCDKYGLPCNFLEVFFLFALVVCDRNITDK